jgi:peptidoglycan/LPS O-acetylase OafA/YrhL
MGEPPNRSQNVFKGRELSDTRLQINSLDGLRGLAVLLVFLSHTSNKKEFLLPYLDFSGVGKSGVFLFFVLSSFLLTLPFIQKGTDAARQEFLLNYFVRRFFRIYPLYILYLLMALATTLTLSKVLGQSEAVGIPFSLSFDDFVRQLMLMKGLGVTWSILVEFRYYFVLPILALTFSVILKNKLLPSAILTLILIVVCQFIWPQAESRNNDPRLGPYLPIFFMGSLLAVFHYNWQHTSLSNNKKAVMFVQIMGFICILIILGMIPSITSHIIGREISSDYYHTSFIQFGVLWSMVVLACIVGDGLIKKCFENSILRYLGFISFSIYLLHVVVYALLYKLIHNIPLFGWITLGITIAVSHVSWLLIEKPSSKVKFKKKSSNLNTVPEVPDLVPALGTTESSN